uniref:hypothetical protein n=1 Tax=Trichocoleus desertorum TaxID=1481672 RepID=UPI0025B3A78C|nr:hypothetical protein [Trichocoleus desertorum]
MPTPAKKTNKSITFTPEAADQTLLAAIEQALTKEQYDSFSDLCKQALQQALLDTESAQLANSNIDLEAVLAPIQQQVAQLEAKLLTSQSQRLDELKQQLVHTIQQLEALHAKGDRGFSELQAGISALPSTSVVDPTDFLSELMQLLQGVEQSNTNLQQQVETVQTQLSSWKQPTNNPTTEYLNQLTSQLVHLTTQVEAIETKISQQFADLQSRFSQHQPVPPVSVPSPSVAAIPAEPVSTQAGLTDAHGTPEPVLVFKEPPPKATIAASSHESDPILSRLSSLLEDF